MKQFWAVAVLVVSFHALCAAKECSSPGNFQNDDVGKCDNYTLCLTAGINTYVQLNFTCPDGFIFNHIYSRCTNETNYQCAPDYKCLGAGNFTNPRENTCMYIACVKGLNDVMTARLATCPLDHFFDPVARSCVNSNGTAFECIKSEPALGNVNSCTKCATDHIVLLIYLLVTIIMVLK